MFNVLRVGSLVIILALVAIVMTGCTPAEEMEVIEGTLAARDFDVLISMLEFAVWGEPELLEGIITIGILEGELMYFYPGATVRPTGRVKYYHATDGRLAVIEVRTAEAAGLWWIFAIHVQ